MLKDFTNWWSSVILSLKIKIRTIQLSRLSNEELKTLTKTVTSGINDLTLLSEEDAIAGYHESYKIDSIALRYVMLSRISDKKE